MEKNQAPELFEKWKAIAKQYHGTREKLAKERAGMHALLDTTRKQLESIRGLNAPVVPFLEARQRMVELTLRQLEAFSLDSEMYAPAPEALTPAYQARQLELTHAILRMERVTFRLIDDLLATELPRLRAGEPVPDGLPEFWTQAGGPVTAADDQLALWEKFRQDFAIFDAAMQALDEGLQKLPVPESDHDYLDLLKQLNIPAVKGHQYRAFGALRMLPNGEKVNLGARKHLLDSIGPLAASRRPQRPGRAQTNRLIERVKPAAGATDRLREFFKPPSK